MIKELSILVETYALITIDARNEINNEGSIEQLKPGRFVSPQKFLDDKTLYDEFKAIVVSDNWTPEGHPADMTTFIYFGIAYYLKMQQQEAIYIEDIPELLLIDRRMLRAVDIMSHQRSFAPRAVHNALCKKRSNDGLNKKAAEEWEKIRKTILQIEKPEQIQNRFHRVTKNSIATAILKKYEKTNHTTSPATKTIISYLENNIFFTEQIIEDLNVNPELSLEQLQKRCK